MRDRKNTRKGQGETQEGESGDPLGGGGKRMEIQSQEQNQGKKRRRVILQKDWGTTIV